MNTYRPTKTPKRSISLLYAVGIASLLVAAALSLPYDVSQAARLAAFAPGLGAAASYSVLGKAGVNNTGASVLSGNVGADSSIIGFPPGMAKEAVVSPAVDGAEADANAADQALLAQSDKNLTAGPDLSGLTLDPGTYSVGAARLSSELTLNGAGVYIFIAADLASSGSIRLINGALACNVFWHVTGGAEIRGGSFVGTIIAGDNINFGDGASLNGRALSLAGTVNLLNNAISGPICSADPSETPVPTIEPVITTEPVATTEPITTISLVLPDTGADLTAEQARSARQAIQIKLGLLGIGLVMAGYLLKQLFKK